MIRSQVYLTIEERNYLHAFSYQTGRSQSELIREAIDLFIKISLEEKTLIKKNLEAAQGLWKNRTDLPNFKSIREEFDRE